ncbi:hypothetical protein [Rhizobium sp. NLR13a]|uniref:hypothetical protein n=1 Tax=unclassified Rhizobium TaxID=2613769 RepID=UPI002180D050
MFLMDQIAAGGAQLLDLSIVELILGGNAGIPNQPLLPELDNYRVWSLNLAQRLLCS